VGQANNSKKEEKLVWGGDNSLDSRVFSMRARDNKEIRALELDQQCKVNSRVSWSLKIEEPSCQA
jgi:hypothetical protein